MASEQTVVAIALFAVSFLWYSNELNKKGAYLWGQAFQVFCFLFMIANFTIMSQLFRSDGLFEMEDVVLNGLMTLITWVMWALVFTWTASLVLNVVSSIREKNLESADSIGVNRFGPK